MAHTCGPIAPEAKTGELLHAKIWGEKLGAKDRLMKEKNIHVFSGNERCFLKLNTTSFPIVYTRQEKE